MQRAGFDSLPALSEERSPKTNKYSSGAVAEKVNASCKGMVENSDTVRFRDAIGSLNIM